MIALVLFLLAAGLDRLLISESWPLLDGPRRRWREWRPRVLGYLRSGAGTYIYLFVLLITSWVLQTSSKRIANALLLERSTYLHQLARGPVPGAVLVRVLGRPLRRLGRGVNSAQSVRGAGRAVDWHARTALVFVIGHVGATLITAAGLPLVSCLRGS